MKRGAALQALATFVRLYGKDNWIKANLIDRFYGQTPGAKAAFASKTAKAGKGSALKRVIDSTGCEWGLSWAGDGIRGSQPEGERHGELVMQHHSDEPKAPQKQHADSGMLGNGETENSGWSVEEEAECDTVMRGLVNFIHQHSESGLIPAGSIGIFYNQAPRAMSVFGKKASGGHSRSGGSELKSMIESTGWKWGLSWETSGGGCSIRAQRATTGVAAEGHSMSQAGKLDAVLGSLFEFIAAGSGWLSSSRMTEFYNTHPDARDIFGAASRGPTKGRGGSKGGDLRIVIESAGEVWGLRWEDNGIRAWGCGKTAVGRQRGDGEPMKQRMVRHAWLRPIEIAACKFGGGCQDKKTRAGVCRYWHENICVRFAQGGESDCGTAEGLVCLAGRGRRLSYIAKDGSSRVLSEDRALPESVRLGTKEVKVDTDH
jgi:hypothetical protein